ncbi:MAG: metal-sulfur cluster assembly factor [Bacillaceae bacterium]|nr:metal-sulfur cluster assembly factor [Bacillaceae bacterium]
MELKDQVMSALKRVIDPELGVNVVDLGLIYQVNVDEDGNVSIRMTLTTPGCPLHDSISNGVRQAVMSVPEVKNVDVELVWEPAWTPERMTEEGRRRLGGI